MASKNASPIRSLRRYAGTRLFDPGSQAYLSVGDLKLLVRQGVRVSVRDAATGQDVTDEVVRPNLQ